MPFKSVAQQRWGHTAAGIRALGGARALAEWDRHSRGKALPQRVQKTRIPKLVAEGRKPKIGGY